jgi:membrane-associated PAP2 superfamily phosphatase
MTRMRWATFLMGAWVAGALLVSVMASQNFYTIDRLLAGSPSQTFRSLTDQLGDPHGRELLRYLSSELNRLYFQLWNAAQIAIGVIALLLVGRQPSSRRIRWALAGMLAVVVVMGALLAPQIIVVGRSLDFVPRDPPPPALARFGILHAAYATLELAKLAMGVVVAAWMIRLEQHPEASWQAQR